MIYIDSIQQKVTQTITITPGTMVAVLTGGNSGRRGIEISNNTSGTVYIRTASPNATAPTTCTSSNAEIQLAPSAFIALGYESTLGIYMDGSVAGPVVFSEVLS